MTTLILVLGLMNFIDFHHNQWLSLTNFICLSTSVHICHLIFNILKFCFCFAAIDGFCYFTLLGFLTSHLCLTCERAILRQMPVVLLLLCSILLWLNIAQLCFHMWTDLFGSSFKLLQILVQRTAPVLSVVSTVAVNIA